ncbi:Hypothetical predicted protein, partial [Paramuricea clavata]
PQVSQTDNILFYPENKVSTCNGRNLYTLSTYVEIFSHQQLNLGLIYKKMCMLVRQTRTHIILTLYFEMLPVLNSSTLQKTVNLPGYNFLSCHRTASKNIVVGVVYRSPNQNLSLFLDKFNEILSTISKNNKHCYIMGDYNIDMYCLNVHSATNEFVENLFFQYVLAFNKYADAHHSTFETPPPRKSAEKTIFRDFSDSNISKFRSHLTNVNWENLPNQDADSAFDAFQYEFSRLYDLSFPSKSVRAKNSNKPLTPWMTRGLLTCVRKKNKLYKKTKTSLPSSFISNNTLLSDPKDIAN